MTEKEIEKLQKRNITLNSRVVRLEDELSETKGEMERMVKFFTDYTRDKWYIAYLQDSVMKLAEQYAELQGNYFTVNQLLLAERKKHEYWERATALSD